MMGYDSAYKIITNHKNLRPIITTSHKRYFSILNFKNQYMHPDIVSYNQQQSPAEQSICDLCKIHIRVKFPINENFVF